MSTTIAEAPRRELTIRERLKDPAMIAEFGKAMPAHCKPERMARVALTAITRTPALADCDQASFFKAMLELSQWGLEPDGRRAHLIPFRNNKRGVTEVQLIIDWKGLAELVYRSGIVTKLHADVVHEGDLFEFNMGEVAKHVPWFVRRDADKPAEQGKVFAAYAQATLTGGLCKAEVLSREEVEGIRKRSRAGNNGPWVTDWSEMAKKGLALDTPIPTPDGWTTMGELSVGDSVFDMHGNQTSVMAVSEVKLLPCYRMSFANGDSIVCDDEHLWVATVGKDGSKARRNGWPAYEIADLHAAKRHGKIVSVPVAGAIDCGDWCELPVQPWVLGYWLGNGNAADGKVTCHVDDQSEIVRRHRECGYSIGANRQDARSKACNIGVLSLKAELRELGVLGSKHIPALYLRATTEQRRKLLWGLMDSDGCIEKRRGRAIFSSTSQTLAEQTYELVCSLGEYPKLSRRMQTGYGKTVMCYRIEWTPSFCPCTVRRKAAQFRPRKIAKYRGVSNIEVIASVPTRCIAVDAETRTYLAGRSMVPTHNTAFRRLSKWLPLSADLRDAMDRDDDRFEPIAAPARQPAVSLSDITAGLIADGERYVRTDEESQEVAGSEPTVQVLDGNSKLASEGVDDTDHLQDGTDAAFLDKPPLNRMYIEGEFARCKNVASVDDVFLPLLADAGETDKKWLRELAEATRERLRAAKRKTPAG